jgi:hypothetical protein
MADRGRPAPPTGDKDGVSDQTESTSKGTDDYGGADPGPAGYGGPAGSVADNSSVAEGWGKTETGWGRSGDPATATGKSKPEEKGFFDGFGLGRKLLTPLPRPL